MAALAALGACSFGYSRIEENKANNNCKECNKELNERVNQIIQTKCCNILLHLSCYLKGIFQNQHCPSCAAKLDPSIIEIIKKFELRIGAIALSDFF